MKGTGGLSTQFWRLWTSSAVSNLGDGIRLTALPLLITALTRDPVVVSGVTAATMAPWIVASLPAGAIVDRIDRRRLMIAGQFTRCAVLAMLATAVATGAESVPLIYLTAFTIGLCEVFVDTSSQAAIPMLVPGTQLENANSKFLAAEFVANDAVGGPVGAWMFSLLPALPFFFNSATFAVAAVLVMGIGVPLQEEATGATRSMKDDIKEGIVFVARHRLLLGLALTVSGANLALGANGAILVLLALEVLGISEVGFGLLVTAGAFGGFAGAVLARRAAGWLGRRLTMTIGGALLAVGLLIMGVAVSGPMAATGLLVGAFGISIFSVVGRALRQAVTPDRLLGRVVTVFRLVGVGAGPFGAVLGGVVASAFGIRTTYLVGAGIMAVVATAIYLVASETRITESVRGVRPGDGES